MKTRTAILALAALSSLSLAALTPTSASAWGMNGYGNHIGYGSHWGGIGRYGFLARRHGMGYWGQDVLSRRTFLAPHENCECEAPVAYTPPPAHECACEAPAPVVHKVYIPVRVPVRVEVPVPVRVEVKVPVPVRVPVYVPVKQAEPCNCEAPAPQRQVYVPPPAPEPCDCEETAPQSGYPQTSEPRGGGRRVYDQNRNPNYASNQLQK